MSLARIMINVWKHKSSSIMSLTYTYYSMFLNKLINKNIGHCYLENKWWSPDSQYDINVFWDLKTVYRLVHAVCFYLIFFFFPTHISFNPVLKSYCTALTVSLSVYFPPHPFSISVATNLTKSSFSLCPLLLCSKSWQEWPKLQVTCEWVKKEGSRACAPKVKRAAL